MCPCQHLLALTGALWAQAGRPILPWGWGVGELAIAVIVIAAVVAVVWVALRQYGVAIPAWAQHVFWILVVAFVCVLAVKVLMLPI